MKSYIRYLLMVTAIVVLHVWNRVFNLATVTQITEWDLWSWSYCVDMHHNPTCTLYNTCSLMFNVRCHQDVMTRRPQKPTASMQIRNRTNMWPMKVDALAKWNMKKKKKEKKRSASSCGCSILCDFFFVWPSSIGIGEDSIAHKKSYSSNRYFREYFWKSTESNNCVVHGESDFPNIIYYYRSSFVSTKCINHRQQSVKWRTAKRRQRWQILI